MGLNYFVLERLWRYALWVVCALVLFFLTAPLIAVVPLSFNSEPYFTFPISAVSTQWYEEVFAGFNWRFALFNSVIIAVPVTVLATTLGVLASLGLTLANFRGKALAIGLILAPMMVPHLIVGVGMYFFYVELGIVGTFWGMLLAHTTIAVPFVVLVVTATLANFNINLMRAGANLGANPQVVFFRIVLPLIMPGVLAGAVLAFIHSFDEVIIALLISGSEYKTLPQELYAGVVDEVTPVITAVATILIAFSFLIMGAAEVLRRRAERLRSARFARA